MDPNDRSNSPGRKSKSPSPKRKSKSPSPKRKSKSPTKKKAVKKGSGSSSAAKAGITVSVGRVHNNMKRLRSAERVSFKAAVRMAAFLDYLAKDVLERATKVTTEHKMATIKPQFIKLGVDKDDGLCQFLCHAIVAGGGVTPTVTGKRKKEEETEKSDSPAKKAKTTKGKRKGKKKA